MSKGTIQYTHENGYTAKLYGNSSLCVYFEGKEVLHTAFRNIETEEEVMALLGEMPAFRENIVRVVEGARKGGRNVN